MQFFKSGSHLVMNMLGGRKVKAVNSIGHGLRRASYGGDVPYKAPTLSELPVPEGSWALHHAQMNRKYNRQLILGASFFVFTIVFIVNSGLVTLNATIPSLGVEYNPVGSCDPNPKPKKC